MNVGAPMHLVFRKDIEIVPYHVTLARPIPLHFKEQALAQIQKMIDDKIITKVDKPTPWLAPAFFIPSHVGPDYASFVTLVNSTLSC